VTDWYYHDPSQGRVGPHTAQELRARYRDRRIQRDTLVWHAGLREWQPLDRLSEELELDSVQPDASLPPPLPPPLAAAPVYATPRPAAGAQRNGAHRNGAPQRGLSGCAIVAIVLGALAIPVIGILAAIAMPAYQDYTVRAKSTAGLIGAASAIKRQVAAHVERTGSCPGNDDMAPVIRRFAGLHPKSRLRFGAMETGHCAFEFTLGGMSPAVEGGTWLYVAHQEGGGLAWDCSGGSLPDRYRPASCRAR
jgi:type IV pilus assembly protein PilA